MIPETLQTFPDAVAVSGFDPEAILNGKFDRNELTLDVAPARIVAVLASRMTSSVFWAGRAE